MQITDVRVRKVAKEGKLKAVVSITLDDEFVVHDIKVIEGEKGKVPTKPTKPGYIFDGWYFGEERWSFSQNPITQDMLVVAKWTPSENTVVFDGNGADGGSVEEIKGATFSAKSLSVSACIYSPLNQRSFSKSNTAGDLETPSIVNTSFSSSSVKNSLSEFFGHQPSRAM